MPWIETGCAHRLASLVWTTGYWEGLGIEVVHGRTEEVNRAAARNAAAAKAVADILFFCDADIWVPAEQFHAAVEAAASGRMVLAYTHHTRLARDVSARVVT